MDNLMLQILEDSGLTNKEARVYLSLLELKSGDVTDIAGISGLKRSIIYVVLEGLIKRGYVNKIPDNKINIYQAVDPIIFLNKLKVLTKNFSQMMPLFQTLSHRGTIKPKISYIDQLDGIWNMFEEMNHTIDPFFVTSYSKIEKIFPHAIDKWVRNYKNGSYALIGKHMISDSPEELAIGRRLLDCNQHVRIVSGAPIGMDFTLFGDRLAISSLENDPFMVVIESKLLVDSMRIIFDQLWVNGSNIC